MKNRKSIIGERVSTDLALKVKIALFRIAKEVKQLSKTGIVLEENPKDIPSKIAASTTDSIELYNLSYMLEWAGSYLLDLSGQLRDCFNEEYPSEQWDSMRLRAKQEHFQQIECLIHEKPLSQEYIIDTLFSEYSHAFDVSKIIADYINTQEVSKSK